MRRLGSYLVLLFGLVGAILWYIFFVRPDGVHSQDLKSVSGRRKALSALSKKEGLRSIFLKTALITKQEVSADFLFNPVINQKKESKSISKGQLILCHEYAHLLNTYICDFRRDNSVFMLGRIDSSALNIKNTQGSLSGLAAGTAKHLYAFYTNEKVSLQFVESGHLIGTTDFGKPTGSNLYLRIGKKPPIWLWQTLVRKIVDSGDKIHIYTDVTSKWSAEIDKKKRTIKLAKSLIEISSQLGGAEMNEANNSGPLFGEWAVEILSGTKIYDGRKSLQVAMLAKQENQFTEFEHARSGFTKEQKTWLTKYNLREVNDGFFYVKSEDIKPASKFVKMPITKRDPK